MSCAGDSQLAQPYAGATHARVTRKHATGYTTMQEVGWQLDFLRGARGRGSKGEDGLRAAALVPGQLAWPILCPTLNVLMT